MRLYLIVLNLFVITKCQKSDSVAQVKPIEPQPQFEKDTDLKQYLTACRSRPEIRDDCKGYACQRLHHDTDPKSLDRVRCRTLKDCLHRSTGFICGSGGYCDCPRGAAFNVTSCSCQKALGCHEIADGFNNTNDNQSEDCHKGMLCSDRQCSCRDLTRTLFEIHGHFCVVPKPKSALDAQSSNDQQQQQQQFYSNYNRNRGFFIALCLIGAFVSLAVIAVLIYVLSGKYKANKQLAANNRRRRSEAGGPVSSVFNCCSGGGGCCDRGEYDCDEKKPKRSRRTRDSSQDGGERHVAAWDLPSLDYLSEEQTLKYLRNHERRITHHQHHQHQPDIPSTSDSSSTSAGEAASSLPESDSRDLNNRGMENRAFVVDDDAIQKSAESEEL